MIRTTIGLALAALAFFPMPASAETTLTLYTSQPQQDAQQTVDAFMAKHPDIRIDWVRDGTTQVLSKLRAEIAAGDPKPDLLLLADVVTFEGLKQQGMLLAHPAADVSTYDKSLHDPDKTYFSTKLITTGIAYNGKAPAKPAAWKDLIKPEFKGQVSMPSPLTSGAAMIHLAALTEHPDFGWAFFEQLAKNNIRPQGGNGAVLKAVAGGEKLYGVIVDYLPIREKAKGAPVDFVFPAEGVTAVTEPVAILRTSKQPEAARKFVDFLLSKEGQELATKQGYLPMHPDIAPPAGFPKVSDIKIMAYDPARALAQEEAFKKRFIAIFGE
jgi:iron(III) transport system substrate-binding protein